MTLDRIDVPVSKSTLTTLDELKDFYGHPSHAETIRKALFFYNQMVQHYEKGCRAIARYVHGKQVAIDRFMAARSLDESKTIEPENLVTLPLDIKVKPLERIDELVRKQGHATRGDLISTAVELYDAVSSAYAEGGNLMIYLPDGRKHVLQWDVIS